MRGRFARPLISSCGCFRRARARPGCSNGTSKSGDRACWATSTSARRPASGVSPPRSTEPSSRTSATSCPARRTNWSGRSRRRCRTRPRISTSRPRRGSGTTSARCGERSKSRLWFSATARTQISLPLPPTRSRRQSRSSTCAVDAFAASVAGWWRRPARSSNSSTTTNRTCRLSSSSSSHSSTVRKRRWPCSHRTPRTGVPTRCRVKFSYRCCRAMPRRCNSGCRHCAAPMFNSECHSAVTRRLWRKRSSAMPKKRCSSTNSSVPATSRRGRRRCRASRRPWISIRRPCESSASTSPTFKAPMWWPRWSYSRTAYRARVTTGITQSRRRPATAAPMTSAASPK